MKNKAFLNPATSEKYPNNGGMIAPPTIAVHNKPEAFGFSGPRPSIANVKMVGNIIELNNPTASILHIAIMPWEAIEVKTNTDANEAKRASTYPGFIILVK